MRKASFDDDQNHDYDQERMDRKNLLATALKLRLTLRHDPD